MVKKYLTIILAVLVLLNIDYKVNAEETVNGSTSAGISTSSVVLGNQVKLTITLKCDTGVGGGKIKVYYTPSYLKFDSFDSSYFNCSNNGNYLVLVVDGTSNTSVSVSLYFSAILIGSSALSVEIVSDSFVDFAGKKVASYTHNYNFPIEIINKSTSTPPSTVTLSNDATLYSLKVNGLKFEEDFSSSKYDYTIYSDEVIDKLNIEAVCCSSKASFVVENNELKEGWNEVKVICTAEDGSKKTYIIKVYIKEAPTVFYNEKLGVVKNLDKVEAPEGFEKTEIVLENNEITVFSHNKLNLIYLINENNYADFYLIDLDSNKLIGKYEPIEISGKTFLQVEFSYQDFPEMNELFNENKYKINSEVILNCWSYKADNMDNYRILYLMDDTGETNLYCYEASEKTIQKYTMANFQPEETDMTTEKLILYSLCISSGFCLIVSIILSLKRKKEIY